MIKGKIGIISYNGKIQVVGPGRYTCFNPRAKIVAIKSVNDNLITYEILTIVRILRGNLGIASENGNPVLLAEGLHVRNNRLFLFEKSIEINQNYIQHRSIHIIRVPKGHYGLVTENNIPKVLSEGVHVVNSNVFRFDKLECANKDYINHGTIHIIRVAKGKIALVRDNNLPKFLKEGTHCINTNIFTYHGMEDLTKPLIRHATLTRFWVKKGEIGLAWDNDQPIFFIEGIYEKDSPTFIFEKCVSASDKLIFLGSKKIVTVNDGEVGVSYFKGKLQVLPPNRHIIESAEHVIQGFISTQQQSMHLDDPKDDSDNIICETKDFVQIEIKADVFYKINDPEKALLVVGKDAIP